MYQLSRLNNHRPHNADPFAQIARDFFGLPIATTSKTDTAFNVPNLDLVESENRYTLRADLPGIAEDNLEITFHEGVLSIHGTRSEETVTEEANVLVSERKFGDFQRRLKLPKDANPDRIEAKLDAGVLTISIEKREEVKARKIELG